MASQNSQFSSLRLQPNYRASASFSFSATMSSGMFPVPADENSKNGIDIAFFDSFPPGYRFCPTEVELILCYLKRKIKGQTLPKSKIMDVNLYEYNPEKLAEEFKRCGEKEWYFFTPRNKKYPNGSRPNRAAGEGFWKATGSDSRIEYEGKDIGLKKVLVFYMGKPPKGEKTDWIMQEFKVLDAPVPKRKHQGDMKLDDWVLCKIYNKNDKPGRSAPKNPQITEEIPSPNPNHEDAAHVHEVHEDAAPAIQMEIDPNYQQFNPNSRAEFDKSFIHNVNYFPEYSYLQQQPLSSCIFGPYVDVAAEYNYVDVAAEYASMSNPMHDIATGYASMNPHSNPTHDIAVGYASMNLHSDPMIGNTTFDLQFPNEDWTMVEYPDDDESRF
ncbi:NAC domain-containing protein 72-like [Euphorbia lathyris]|uniref:NAC domain-containing protein 72-like n=1 Tax=Euphorbia lathyris TaxID=212925 RepID=UPI0033130A99